MAQHVPAPPLSRKQVFSWQTSIGKTRFTLWDGSIRSGKTFVSLLAWLSWIPKAPRGSLVIIGKTKTTVVRNILDAIALIANKAIGSYSTHSDHVTIMGRRVWIVGANDAQAETKIRGWTLAGAYVDEVTLLPESLFVQLLGRLSVKGARLFGTTNPDNPEHWLNKRYILRIPSPENTPAQITKRGTKEDDILYDWGIHHFTMDDNPSLDPDYVAAKKREFTGLFYRRFILGQWVSAEGAVYDMWDPNRHVVRWQDVPPVVEFLATGIDYGTTNATAALALALCEDGRLYFVNEKRIQASGAQARYTDAEQSKMILDWLRDTELAPNCDYKPQWTIIDPAAASFRVQMHQDGAWGLQPAYNDVLYGIRVMANGLTGGWLKIADTCEGLISEIPGYSWDPKAELQGIDKPIKVADHSCDAARYALATTENRWRPIIEDYARGGHYAATG